MIKQKNNPVNARDASYDASLASNKENKNMIMAKIARHKVLVGIIIIIFLSWVISLPFVAINIPNNRDAHSIGSIAFDKWQMNRVNRIEIQEHMETIVTIYDEEFINDFINHTMVAKAAGFNSIFGRYTISLYRDDTLVRKMDLCELHSLIRVYHQSPRHRFFWTAIFLATCSCCGGGLVELPRHISNEIWQKIYENE